MSLNTNPANWENVKIGTYAICKNEIKHIDIWLPLVWNNGNGSDYICILDTGSTDGTYEKFIEKSKELNIPEDRFIIKQTSYTKFRFDVARNDNLDQIPKDKVDVCFSLDIDEYIDVDFWNDLRKLVFEHPDFDRIYYRYEQRTNLIFWYDKCHSPNNWIWKEPVHEYLYNQEKGLNIKGYYLDTNKLYLVHHQDKVKSRTFYLDLLKERCKEDPNDIYSLYYIGAILCEEDTDYIQAISYFEKCAIRAKHVNVPTYQVITNSFYKMGKCYYLLGGHPDMVEFYYKLAIEEDKTFGAAYIELAQFYAYQGLTELARKTLAEYDTNAIIVERWDNRPHLWTRWKRCQILGIVLCWEGKYEEAMQTFIEGEQSITEEYKGVAYSSGFYSDMNWCKNKLESKK